MIKATIRTADGKRLGQGTFYVLPRRHERLQLPGKLVLVKDVLHPEAETPAGSAPGLPILTVHVLVEELTAAEQVEEAGRRG